MPVYGLPTALESSLNSLIQLRGPSSWRVSGHSDDITVVLRWTASKMWAAESSPSKEWPGVSSKTWPVTHTPIYSTEKNVFDFNNVASCNDDVFTWGSGNSSGVIGGDSTGEGRQHSGKYDKTKSNFISSNSSSSSSSSTSQTHKISSSSKKRKRKHSSSSTGSSCSSSVKQSNNNSNNGKERERDRDHDRSSGRISTNSTHQTPTSSGIHYINNHNDDNISMTDCNNSCNDAKSSTEKATKSTKTGNTNGTSGSAKNTSGSADSNGGTTFSPLGNATMAVSLSDPYPVYITSSEYVISNDLIMQDETNNHNHHHHENNSTPDSDCVIDDDNISYNPSKMDTKFGIIKVPNIYNESELLIDSNDSCDNYTNQFEDRHKISNQHQHHHHNNNHHHRHHHKQKSSVSSNSSTNSTDSSFGHHHKSAFKSPGNSHTKISSNEKHNPITSGAQRTELASPSNSNFYSIVAKALQKDPESSSNAGSGGNTKKGGQRRGSSKIHKQASFDNPDMVFVERRPTSAMSVDDKELSAVCSVEVLEH